MKHSETIKMNKLSTIHFVPATFFQKSTEWLAFQKSKFKRFMATINYKNILFDYTLEFRI